MVRLLHYAVDWPADSDSAGMVGMRFASRESEAFDDQTFPGAIIQHRFYATSYLDAMNQYNAWRGWGPYEPLEGFHYVSYIRPQLEAQAAEYPDDPVLAEQLAQAQR